MIQFTATPELRRVLAAKQIDPSLYRPAYGESAGLDLYYSGTSPLHIPPAIPEGRDPRISYPYLQLPLLPERFTTVIPTGLKIALAPDRVGLIFQRFSVTKTPLLHRGGVIDAGFTGEIKVSVINLDDKQYTFNPGDKLPFQLVVTVVDTQYCFVDEEAYALATKHSRRGVACSGSSDGKEVLFEQPKNSGLQQSDRSIPAEVV